MLILMLVGVICRKTGIISSESNKELSKFVLQIVNPVVIFMSYQTELRGELVRNLLIAFAVSAAVFLIMIAASYLHIRKKEKRETEIERC